jgi:peptidoglycan/LPS O-acetylase OafA/YrhL
LRSGRTASTLLIKRGGGNVSALDRPGRSKAVDRLLRVFLLLAVLAVFGLCALLAHGSARADILGGLSAVVVALVVALVWDALPERRRPQARFSRAQLMSAVFGVILVPGGLVAPDIIQHKMSTRDWIVFCIFIAVMFVGLLVAERRDQDRVERDLREWRRTRPQVRPKLR